MKALIKEMVGWALFMLLIWIVIGLIAGCSTPCSPATPPEVLGILVVYDGNCPDCNCEQKMLDQGWVPIVPPWYEGVNKEYGRKSRGRVDY